MNTQIFYFLYNYAHQTSLIYKSIIFFADTFPKIVILLAGVFLVMHHDALKADNSYDIVIKKWKEIVLVFLSGIAAYVLAYIVKFIVHAPRPFDAFKDVHSLITETGYAFPSGHATFFAALAVSIFFMHKRAGYVFMVFALVIGIARIMAGVHFPIDILGGFVLGAIVSYAVAYFRKTI
jgi:membrane-associated phospholipid phosphatase